MCFHYELNHSYLHISKVAFLHLTVRALSSELSSTGCGVVGLLLFSCLSVTSKLCMYKLKKSEFACNTYIFAIIISHFVKDILLLEGGGLLSTLKMSVATML